MSWTYREPLSTRLSRWISRKLCLSTMPYRQRRELTRLVKYGCSIPRQTSRYKHLQRWS